MERKRNPEKYRLEMANMRARQKVAVMLKDLGYEVVMASRGDQLFNVIGIKQGDFYFVKVVYADYYEPIDYAELTKKVHSFAKPPFIKCELIIWERKRGFITV